MIEQAFLWAILGMAALTAGIFLVVAMRESIRVFHLWRGRRRRRKCEALVSTWSTFTEREAELLRERCRVEDLEAVLSKGVKERRWDAKTSAFLFERTGVLEHYVRDLYGAAHWTDRAQAALHLGRTGSRLAVGPLLRTLLSPQEDQTHVKPAAAQGLAELRDPRAVPELIDAMEHGDSETAAVISDALASFGSDAVEPLLDRLSMLAHARTPQQQAYVLPLAARTLGELKDTRAVYPLVEHLKHPDPDVRTAMAESLGKLEDRRGVHALIDRMLHDPSSSVRSASAQSLAELKDERALEPLLRGLGDPDPHLRRRAVDALELLGEPAREGLIRTLLDPNPQVRLLAAQGLERMGGVFDAIQELAAANAESREKAASTLERIGRAGVVEAILDGLRHTDPRVRSRLCEILGRVASPAACEGLARCLTDPVESVQIQAALALGKIPDRVPPEEILQLLGSPSEEVRWAAAQTALALPGEALAGHLRLLYELAQDEKEETRIAAIRLLGKVGSDAAVDILADFLASEDSQVRESVCESLSETHRPSALSSLSRALKDKEPRVRRSAVRSVGRLGRKEGLDILMSSLEAAPADEMAQSIVDLDGTDVTQTADRLMGLPSPATRRVLLRYLVRANDPRAARFVRSLIRSRDPEILRDAIELSGRFRDKGAVSTLVEHLGSREEEIRIAAAKALALTGGKEGLGPILARISSESPRVRGELLIWAGLLGGREVESELVPWLEGGSIGEQAGAVLGLGLAGCEKRSEQLLLRLVDPALEERVFARLKQEGQEITTRFFQTLYPGEVTFDPETIGESRFLRPFLRDLAESHDPVRRERAARILGLLRISEAAEPLKQSVREDPEEGVRVRGMEALMEVLPEGERADLLVECLADPASVARQTAVDRLAGVGTPEVNLHLLEILRSNDRILFAKTVEALAEINRENLQELEDRVRAEQDPKLVEGLCRAIGRINRAEEEKLLSLLSRHEAAEIRAAAARETAELVGETLPDVLDELLSDPAPQVRLAALQGLVGRKIGGFRGRIEPLEHDPIREVRQAAHELLTTKETA